VDKLTDEEMALAKRDANLRTNEIDGKAGWRTALDADSVMRLARAYLQLADERNIPLSIENDRYRVDTVDMTQIVTAHPDKIIGRIIYNELNENWEAYSGFNRLPLGRYDIPEAAAEAIWTTWEAEQDE
jgi:hypothetical protein